MLFTKYIILIYLHLLPTFFNCLTHDLLYNNRPVHFIKKHCESVSEKEPIFADEGATVRALLKNKNTEKYV
jgi:hypothetical protein